MLQESETRGAGTSDDDVLLSLRDRITMRMGLLAAAVITPFAILHTASGRTLLGMVDAVAALMLGGNAWALAVRQRPLLPYPALVGTLICAVLASVQFIGSSALVWTFPAALFAYIALPRWQAHGACAVMTAGVAGVAMVTMAPATSLRFVAAAVLMLVLLNVVLGVIGELQRALVQQATTDPLTGAFNRRQMQIELGRIAAAGAVPGGRAHGLLAFDLDNFKTINDRYGHGAGDDVLRRFVTLVRERVRGADRLYRVGGEEFVLLLADIDPADAQALAEDLRRRVEQAELLPGHRVTVSIGVCARGTAADARADTEAWLRDADAALYDAKRAGRNRVAVAA